MYRLKTILAVILIVIACRGFSQIVPPGQVQLLVYPGSNVDRIDNSTENMDSKENKPVRVFLLDDFSEGTLCVNSTDCYAGLSYNIDLLNKVMILNGQDDEKKYLSLVFMDRLYDSLLNKTFSYEVLDKKTNERGVSQMFFQQDEVKFFKRYSVKKLQANYNPQFDTGSKEVTYEVETDFVFVDENNKTTLLKKIKEKRLIKNMPDNKLTAYLSDSNVKVRSIEELIEVLNTVYKS